MPINKNAYLRFRYIDECLRNKNRYFNRYSIAEFISEKLGKEVSVNTIDKDIGLMKLELGAPIKFNKFDNYYFYSSSFSLAGIELNQIEEDALSLSLSSLDILKDTKYAKSYKSFIQKILTKANNLENEGIVEFEQSSVQLYSGLFDTLYDAIKNKEVLVITYQVYGKQRKEHLVSPYMIKEYRNRFYLVAREHYQAQSEELIFCFAMDRIKDVKKNKESFLVTKGFDSKSFFKHSIGITRDLKNKPIELVLKFNKINAPYILSKPLHHSQKVLTQNDDSLTVCIHVYESFELNMAVLSYGSGVEILSPQSYIDYIKNEIKSMSKIYKK